MWSTTTYLTCGGGIWPPSIFSATIHHWVMPFGTLLALYKKFQKMHILFPQSRDKCADVSTFRLLSAKNDENWIKSNLIHPNEFCRFILSITNLFYAVWNALSCFYKKQMKKRLHIMIAKILCVLSFRFLMDFVSDQL